MYKNYEQFYKRFSLCTHCRIFEKWFSEFLENKEWEIQLHPKSECLFMPFVIIIKTRKCGASDNVKPVVSVQTRIRSKYHMVDIYNERRCSLSRCLTGNNRSTKAICVRAQLHDPSSQSVVDLSIQFIGTFNRVRGICFVDDVDDSSIPLFLSQANRPTHQTALRPLRFFTTCTVIDTPLNFGRRLFQGFAHHWLLAHRTYMANKEKRFVVSETTSCTAVSYTLDKGTTIWSGQRVEQFEFSAQKRMGKHNTHNSIYKCRILLLIKQILISSKKEHDH